MIAFVGLGNAEPHYENTKHNAGFWVVDELARRWNLAFKPGKGDYLFAMAVEKNAVLIKPTAGMNRSGPAVKDVVRKWNLDLDNLFVIVDDVDLPLGTLRLRPKGGDGSHRGMESVIYSLGSTHFPRGRFGIAADIKTRPAETYVLKPFKKKDLPLAGEIVQKMADAMESVLAIGLERTMNTYNRTGNTGELN